MMILMRYNEPNAHWEEVSEAECLEHTEGCGYWKKGGVLNLLQKGLTVWTPFAEYKIK